VFSEESMNPGDQMRWNHTGRAVDFDHGDSLLETRSNGQDLAESGDGQDKKVDKGMESESAKDAEIDVLGHIWSVSTNVQRNLIHLSDMRCASRENYTACIKLYRETPDRDS
jgi:hypothetical protein